MINDSFFEGKVYGGIQVDDIWIDELDEYKCKMGVSLGLPFDDTEIDALYDAGYEKISVHFAQKINFSRSYTWRNGETGLYYSTQAAIERDEPTGLFNINAAPIRCGVVRNAGLGNRTAPRLWEYTRAEDFPNRISSLIKIGDQYFSSRQSRDEACSRDFALASYFDDTSTLVARSHNTWPYSGFYWGTQEDAHSWLDFIIFMDFIPNDHSKKVYTIYSVPITCHYNKNGDFAFTFEQHQ